MRFALLGCGERGLEFAAALAELGLEAPFCADPRQSAARPTVTRGVHDFA